ncbi:MAG: hypothetical protein CVU69_04515 [Deltaproteobacteria bacterium HGW-Deltaproteobacteria-4]|nr:MAG: hypothetical protein CVU69_04515 [Deltaproteobacteria bacterium HGW-Deltaproteobacteria-4]
MVRKKSLLLTALITLSALGALTLLVTAPSWSSPARLFVTTAAPETLPAAGADLTLSGGGFSQTTNLWLVPELSLRSATTATLETFGTPTHMIRRGDHLYVANGVGGFLIVQGLQSPVPFISGTLDSEGQSLEVALRRDEALLAAGKGGLQVIDIRDAANPQLLATLKSVVPALSVANSGTIAYVATGKSGVQIVDIADPRHPRHLGALPGLPDAYKLSIDGKVLIIAAVSAGWIYDISRPEQPRRLARLPVPGGVNTVMTRQGETLYWAQRGRLYALDLSRLTSPRLLSSVPLNTFASAISCSDDQLVISLGKTGTQIFPLPAEPQFAPSKTITAKIQTSAALLLDNDLWVADRNGELLRLDLKKAQALTTAPVLPDYSPSIMPLITPDLLFLGDTTGISIYDHRGDTTPRLLTRLHITGLNQQFLSSDQRRLWLTTGNRTSATNGKLISVDLSLFHSPRITAEISLSYIPFIMAEQGATLVISSSSGEKSPTPFQKESLDSLHFIDISQPQILELFASYSLGNDIKSVNIKDHVVVLLQKDGLVRVIDISQAEAPKELGSLQMPWLQSAAWTGQVNIVVKDNVAFISSVLGKVFLIDLHDLRQPKSLGALTLPGPVTSLTSSDHLLLAGVNRKEMVVIDLKNIQAPEILGTIPLPGLFTYSAMQAGQLWFFSYKSKGIWSLPLPHRLQSSVIDDQIIARLAQSPPPGPYRLWLTDKRKHLLIPGISWQSR